MARLSPEQKAANKVASKEHRQAYNARRADYDKAMAEADAQVAALPETAASSEALRSLDVAMDARDQALRDVDAQIAALQEQRKEIAAQHAAVVSDKKADRDATSQAQRHAASIIHDAVRVQFPDLQGVWYPSQWKRPERR